MKWWHIGLAVGIIIPTLFGHFAGQNIPDTSDAGDVGLGIMIITFIGYSILIPIGVILGYCIDKKMKYSAIGALWGFLSAIYVIVFQDVNFGTVTLLGKVLFFPGIFMSIFSDEGGATGIMLIFLGVCMTIIFGAGLGYFFDKNNVNEE